MYVCVEWHFNDFPPPDPLLLFLFPDGSTHLVGIKERDREECFPFSSLPPRLVWDARWRVDCLITRSSSSCARERWWGVGRKRRTSQRRSRDRRRMLC